MRVTLPRDDSPKDKEQQTEKDFREKIAVMEQLFRSLYEIKELNPMNIFKVWLFKRDIVSFEIVAENKIAIGKT